MIEYVTTLTVEGSGILDARHPLQKELNATARGASAPSAGPLKRQTSLRVIALFHPSQTVLGEVPQAVVRPPRSACNLQGSRKRQIEGPDLLLAAVATGQGLRS